MSTKKPLFFLGVLLWGFLSAQDRLVFSTVYNVYWKDWLCGQMESRLVEQSNGQYHYSQELVGGFFLFSFSQKESSTFRKEYAQLTPSCYCLKREGLEGQNYEIHFSEKQAKIKVYPEPNSCEETLFSYDDHQEAIYDKLLVQIALIRSLYHQQEKGAKTVHFIDYKGLHNRAYHLEPLESDQWSCSSDFGKKRSFFLLDAKYRYLPVRFEQYRKGSLFFKGEMLSCVFGPGWDDFIEPHKGEK